MLRQVCICDVNRDVYSCDTGTNHHAWFVGHLYNSAHYRHLLQEAYTVSGDDLLVLSITPVCMEEARQLARPTDTPFPATVDRCRASSVDVGY